MKRSPEPRRARAAARVALIALLGGLGLLASARAEAASTVSVLTYNIRWAAPQDGPDAWAHRRDGIRTYLSTATPDLLALQEVTPAQADFLRAGLGGTFVWFPEVEVAVRLSDRAALLRTERLALPGGAYARGALLVSATLDGRPLTFVSVHLQGGPEGLAQADLLVRALAGWPRPWILAGDVNAYPLATTTCRWLPKDYGPLCNGVYERLWHAGFRDPLARVLGRGPRSTATDFGLTGRGWRPTFDARIDWILATAELEGRAATIAHPVSAAGRPLSDHTPVQVVLRR